MLATGSYPFVPPVPGHDRAQCLVYRTIEDLEAIAAAAKTGKVGTVVGGGLLGLEAAKALKDLGLETHVVEFAPRLMAVQLDEAGGAMLRHKIEEFGRDRAYRQKHQHHYRRRAVREQNVFCRRRRAGNRHRAVFGGDSSARRYCPGLRPGSRFSAAASSSITNATPPIPIFTRLASARCGTA